MFRYKLKNLDTQEIKCIIETDLNVENPWISKFEKFGVFQGMRLEPKNYEVIKEDMTSELATEQAKKDAKDAAKLASKNAKQALKAVKDSTDLATLKAATKDLAKVVHALVKALEFTDPTEGE